MMLDIREHKPLRKEVFHEFLKSPNFNGLEKDWSILPKEKHLVWDRIRVYKDDSENPYEQIDITPIYYVKALLFELNKVNHSSFNFYIYEDYKDPALVYFRPAVYYYGNWIREYVYDLIEPKVRKFPSFNDWCQMLEDEGDNFAMHNYRIDMETVEKFGLMR